MKNPYFISGSSLFVECTNVTPSQFVTCSLEDMPTLASHRWRIIDGYPTAHILSGSLEVRHTLDSVLFGVTRTRTLTRRDKNPLNYSRPNVHMSPSTRENVIVSHEEYSYLILPNAQTVLIDTDDVAQVSLYSWLLSAKDGNPIVITRHIDDGILKRIQLPRLLMDVVKQDNRSVVHHNGDRLDCRKQNLEVIQRRINMNRTSGKGSLPRPLAVSVQTYHTTFDNTFNRTVASGSLNTRDDSVTDRDDK